LIERAKIKEMRLVNLAEKRFDESEIFANAAQELSNSINSQPILSGHHSSNKLNKAQDKLKQVKEKSETAFNASSYWQYRAVGVVNHANKKNDTFTRYNRIKTLLVELRGHQKQINEANFDLSMLTKIKNTKDVEKRKELMINFCNYFQQYKDGVSLWSLLSDNKIDLDESIEHSINLNLAVINGVNRKRSMSHILNRIGYERSFFGNVESFTGELTPTIIQAFLRENGADKPKAKKSTKGFIASSITPLPLHIAKGDELDLSCNGWVNLMKNAGYTVPAPKPKAPPILNFKALAILRTGYRCIETVHQVEMTKEEYGAYSKDSKQTYKSTCGKFRFKAVRIVETGKSYFDGKWFAVFLKDSKIHNTPESSIL